MSVEPILYVTSEESDFDDLARRPWREIAVVRSDFLSSDRIEELSRLAKSDASVDDPGDIDTSWVSLESDWDDAYLALLQNVAQLLAQTRVLGDGVGPYLKSVKKRFDVLGSRGAAFHNDVCYQWSRTLFWVLVLEAADTEMVVPGLEFRHPLAAGDLIVFDPALPHGVTRPADGGLFEASSFAESLPNKGHLQTFLSGELQLSKAQWKRLGCPWVSKGARQFAGGVNLLLAKIDSRTGQVLPWPSES
jgi:hypothetical protein